MGLSQAAGMRVGLFSDKATQWLCASMAMNAGEQDRAANLDSHVEQTTVRMQDCHVSQTDLTVCPQLLRFRTIS